MGFSNEVVDIIKRLIANNWYSIMLNGQCHGFFHSTRGVKQGDPLSPTLFIILDDVLSRVLNSLFEEGQFVGYGLPKWSYNLNHLAYANDTIIFASAQKYSLERIMSTLQEYETRSGQKINKDKSVYYLHQNEAAYASKVMEKGTGMKMGQFPMKYLGCPITHTQKRKEHYSDLIKKVVPVAAVLSIWNLNISQDCLCCSTLQEKLQNIFF